MKVQSIIAASPSKFRQAMHLMLSDRESYMKSMDSEFPSEISGLSYTTSVVAQCQAGAFQAQEALAKPPLKEKKEENSFSLKGTKLGISPIPKAKDVGAPNTNRLFCELKWEDRSKWWPDCNIFMRPAQEGDMEQIAGLYSDLIHDEDETQPLEIHATDTDYWRAIFNRCQEQRRQFIVACDFHKAYPRYGPFASTRARADENGHIQHLTTEGRLTAKQLDAWSQYSSKTIEALDQPMHDHPIVDPNVIIGFAYIEDYAPAHMDPANILRRTARMHVYVVPKHRRKGVGSTLCDRMIALLDQYFKPSSAVRFHTDGSNALYRWGATDKTDRLIISIYFRDEDNGKFKFKKVMLEKLHFVEVGFIYGAAIGRGKRVQEPVHEAIFSRTVPWNYSYFQIRGVPHIREVGIGHPYEPEMDHCYGHVEDEAG